jgi:hypothetical protein
LLLLLMLELLLTIVAVLLLLRLPRCTSLWVVHLALLGVLLRRPTVRRTPELRPWGHLHRCNSRRPTVARRGDFDAAEVAAVRIMSVRVRVCSGNVGRRRWAVVAVWGLRGAAAHPAATRAGKNIARRGGGVIKDHFWVQPRVYVRERMYGTEKTNVRRN